MACLRMFVVVSAAVFLLITAITDSVSSQETCVTKLNPCLPYVNDTTSSIPNTCCNPVKEAITNESACLCSYYNTPGMLESVGIKPSRVADLIRDCKVDGADPDAVCKGYIVIELQKRFDLIFVY